MRCESHTQTIDDHAVTLEAQIAAAKRELALRRGVYPRLAGGVDEKRGAELRAMQAIVQTLEQLKQ